MCKVLQMAAWLMSLCLASLFINAKAEETPPSHQPKPYPAEMNKKFQDEAEIQEFVKRFESEDRDVFLKRQEITRAVGLRQGDKVADIGAGTGLFSFLFAKEIGPRGVSSARIRRSTARSSAGTRTSRPSLRRPARLSRSSRTRSRTPAPGRSRASSRRMRPSSRRIRRPPHPRPTA
jgi:hypothetical protein